MIYLHLNLLINISPITTIYFFCFTQIEQSIITNIIHKLKNKSNHGYDNISNKLLKRASDIIVKPLTLIINQSLSTGISKAIKNFSC